MLISDEVLYKMTDYFQMDAIEADEFVETIRGEQAEIFWKAFFLYYELYKTPLERRYISSLTKNGESQENLEKLFKLVATELENNPEAQGFVSKRTADFVLDLIAEFAKVADSDAKLEVFRALFPYSEPVKIWAQSNLSSAKD